MRHSFSVVSHHLFTLIDLCSLQPKNVKLIEIDTLGVADEPYSEQKFRSTNPEAQRLSPIGIDSALKDSHIQGNNLRSTNRVEIVPVVDTNDSISK